MIKVPDAGEGVTIRRLLDVPATADRDAAIDDIFFAASATRSFADDATRIAFRERWLGRFVEHFPEHGFLAVAGGGGIIGYLVGAIADPAREARFADIGYFQILSELTARFPAHLHINLTAAARNRGVGGRLIEAFARHARACDAPGMHVVTSATSRNRSFYARQGFACEATLGAPPAAIVFLARAL